MDYIKELENIESKNKKLLTKQNKKGIYLLIIC